MQFVIIMHAWYTMAQTSRKPWSGSWTLGGICTAPVTVICGSKSPRSLHNAMQGIFYFSKGRDHVDTIIRAFLWYVPKPCGGVEVVDVVLPTCRYNLDAGYPDKCLNQTVVGAITDSNLYWASGNRPSSNMKGAVCWRGVCPVPWELHR